MNGIDPAILDAAERDYRRCFSDGLRVSIGVTLWSMLIRRETATDIAAIDAVHLAAYARFDGDIAPLEVELVRHLRADSG